MAKGLTKQAKVLSERQVDAVLAVLAKSRRPERDTAAFLLSTKAGLRAKEVAAITWAMVTDREGKVGDEIRLTNDAAKGKKGGRVIDMNRQFKAALIALQRITGGSRRRPIIGGTAAASSTSRLFEISKLGPPLGERPENRLRTAGHCFGKHALPVRADDVAGES